MVTDDELEMPEQLKSLDSLLKPRAKMIIQFYSFLIQP